MRFADFTLSGGPTIIEAPTLDAMGAPMCYHYDPAFLEQYRRTEQLVLRVMKAEGSDPLIMHGEAVLGLEAAWRATVRPGMHCLNLVSGVFGKGMGDWLRMSQGVVHEIVVDYDDAVEPAAVEAYLDAHPEIELVAVVYSETPSGTLNPVQEIGPICRAHGAVTIVDCVSAVGGMPFDADGWQLDICVAGAQKCLAGPPGITLMSVSPQAWELIAKNADAPRWSFMSMLDWKEQWLEKAHFPFTPSIGEVRGLEACCQALLAEGHESSIRRHTVAAEASRAGIRAMGLELWPRRDEIMSTCVTAVKVPDGFTDAQVRAHCVDHYGVMLSGGHGAGNIVRIGHMGAATRSMYPVAGLAALGRTFADLGVSVDIGAGLEAALAIIADAGATLRV
jgi:pyridoxamine--pyruvate transaminase